MDWHFYISCLIWAGCIGIIITVIYLLPGKTKKWVLLIPLFLLLIHVYPYWRWLGNPLPTEIFRKDSYPGHSLECRRSRFIEDEFPSYYSAFTSKYGEGNFQTSEEDGLQWFTVYYDTFRARFIKRGPYENYLTDIWIEEPSFLLPISGIHLGSSRQSTASAFRYNEMVEIDGENFYVESFCCLCNLSRYSTSFTFKDDKVSGIHIYVDSF